MAEVDGIRFVAIAAVFLFHVSAFTDSPRRFGRLGDAAVGTASSAGEGSWTTPVVREVLKTGEAGVQLFFILSGFILGLPFVRAYRRTASSIPLGPYFRRRLSRLEPPLLICISLIVAVRVMWFGSASPNELGHYLATIGYAHGFVFDNMSPINSVTWSLEVEAQFYVAAPLLARLYFSSPSPGRRRLAICASMVALGIFVTHHSNVPFWVSQTLPFHLPYFLAGFLAADLSSSWSSPSRSERRMLDVVALLSLAGFFAARHHNLFPLVLPILGFLFLFCSLRGGALLRALKTPTVAVIGGMCYTIYLYHWVIIKFAGQFTVPLLSGLPPLPRLLAQFALLGAVTLGVCTVLYVALERPFMHSDWRVRLARGLRRMRPGHVSRDSGA